jgi:chemotaxis protein CheY-P-specific phosphatase CheC
MYLLMLFTFFVSGCSNQEAKSISINIPNINDYTVLSVQGVNEYGAASESTSKLINDDKEIKAFINKVNKTEVIKPSNKEMVKKAKLLNNQGNYIFVLSDSKKMNNKLYYMNFFKDGSIQFQQTNKKVMLYTSKEKHPKLLKDLKKALDINF